MLKSLELFGFKSFADRTTFEFAEGITCVVGPNGSGKSNVVDAIKWILGDQSARSLRGKEMADVIFNGAAGRKPSAFAEATLTFDNARGLLPIDAAEVQIGRRLYVGGDSEYLLNRSAVRLKDIRDIFMGTGAGTAAYSIIEQGRVDQILQANPTARRAVFEEAAGISRYKARRLEAQRRLERVDQNLLRLRDIVDELEARLNATRSQASKAARYRELSAELRQLWTGLAADDYRRAEHELARHACEIGDLQEQLQLTDRQTAQLDQRFDELDAAATEREKQLRQIERHRGSERETIARCESSIQHHTALLAELETEIGRLGRERLLLRFQSRAVDQDLAESTQRLQQFQIEFAEQQEALSNRRQRLNTLQSQLEEALSAIDASCAERDAQLEQRSRLEREQAALGSRLDAAMARHGELIERCDALERTLAESRAELGGRKQSLREAEQAVAEAQRKIDNARDERRLLQGAHSESDGRLAAWREQRSAKLARRQLLEDLEARQEGLNQGVRNVLRRADRSTTPPWNLILGNVGDLLQAELDDAPLLEVALGPRVQLLVIRDLDPLIEYVNRASADVAGRVGFVELTPQRQAALSAGVPSATTTGGPGGLHGIPGVVCRADELVSQSAVPGLAAHLLADTWIVETLDDALRLAAESGGRRFVTCQGELLDADGTLHVGHSAAEATVISRKSELRQLRVELQELDRRIAAEQQRLDVLDESLMVSDSDLQALQAALNEQLQRLALRRSEHASQAAECGRVLAEIDAVRTQQAQLEEQRREIELERAARRTEHEELERRSRALTAEIEERQEIARCVQEQLQLLQHEMNAEQLRLAKHEERLLALQAAHMRLLEDQRQRRARAARADVQLSVATGRLRDSTLEVLRSRASLAELFLSDQSRAGQCRIQQQQLEACRADRRQLQHQQDELREHRRRLNDRLHEREMHSRDLRHQMTSLVERIREEFQLDLPELVAAGVTALRPARTSERGAIDPADDEAIDPSIPADRTLHDHSALAEHDLPSAEPAAAAAETERVEIEGRIERLRRKIRALGSINADSLQDLDELEARYGELAAQLADLEEAKAALEDIIRRINHESKRLFLETFEAIRGHFQELYRRLFGGGEGNIILEDPDDVLECGIDIVARPPGKELRSISLLSGGEKTMTAVALLLAMFKSKPSPYCILDEVDAALDEANVDRYVNVVREFRESTQFVIITHRKRTMTAADRLYGVTMEQAGVSKRLTVQFEDVSEDGHFRIDKSAA